MKQKIENAIRETLVIGNKESIHRAVDKIMLIVAQRQVLQQAGVKRSLPPSDDEITAALNLVLKTKKADIDERAKQVWIDGAKWMRDIMLGGNDA